ncbi:Rtm1p [Fusarium beomiforme]|uniref:Rtm1p n=1 Tax=Fusarium beomiforme TaxID=44412 RepID=A0A9P5A9R7_9HYPO|nr:Rtm1p [Fusarium beomiforme]
MSDESYVEGSYWFYAPNKGAAIFFCITFCFSGCYHVWQCIQYNCWRLTPLFPFCSLLFTAGFALRVYGAFHYDNLDIFIASVCITYAAPPLLELQNYRILGRILYYVPYHSPIHPGRVLTTFGFISAIVEALNGWGASYSANQSLTDGEINAGHALIKASLLLQIVVALLFITLAVSFHRRCVAAAITNQRLNKPLWTLYTSMALILARTIYRIVEYFSVAELRYGPGFDPATISPIVRYEWFFYVFEATLMLCNLAMFNIRHPRRYLPRNNKIYLSSDGVTEIEGPGFKDPRKLWQTLIDPFHIQGLVTGRGRESDKFWETSDGRTTDSSKPAGMNPETA